MSSTPHRVQALQSKLEATIGRTTPFKEVLATKYTKRYQQRNITDKSEALVKPMFLNSSSSVIAIVNSDDAFHAKQQQPMTNSFDRNDILSDMQL